MKRELEDIADSISTAVKTDQSDPDAVQLTLFDADAVTDAIGVRVFDVGQGDCIGLLNQDGEVFCYIDYGGLADPPDKENPAATAQRLPVQVAGKRASIILTHWDVDHYWSANKKNRQARLCEWLAPRQMVSPTAARFAAGLPDAKCWPESREQRPARIDVGDECDIEIQKVAPFQRNTVKDNRNKTGLVVTLLRWLEGRLTQSMLLPGDCAFHLIPQLPAVPLSGLVAYHHGARTDWSKKKTGKAIGSFHEARQMAYSCGKHDGYDHPVRANYQPDWDPMAISTPELRQAGQQSFDMLWKG
jgi:hypothetical protein